MIFNFDNTYTKLDEAFYSFVEIQSGEHPQILLLNQKLLRDLDIQNSDDLVDYLSGKKLLEKPYAMAYAGHQFGHFTMLGDGRAALLGEHLTSQNERFDIQLKGSGLTPYSRGGDGKAAAGSMLREYVFCNALDNLGIKSSRALAVILNDTSVYRDYPKAGAMLVRVMQSHVRVGTFEYAAQFLDTLQLQSLADYVIARHYDALDGATDKYVKFFEAVMQRQIDMVVDWMRVGFVHGVMNTDNMSITGETFDYGPCAFMNYYDLGATFSSIDRDGRYSFGNQKHILHWNLARLAQSLLPLVATDQEKAIAVMNAILSRFESEFDVKFYAMMRKKLGFKPTDSTHDKLIDRLLEWLGSSRADYTNTFLALSDELSYQDDYFKNPVFLEIKKELSDTNPSKTLMQQNNPHYIPRNYIVEEAIEQYEQSGSLEKIERLLEVMQNPYQSNSAFTDYQKPPSQKFEKEYTTFCNT